MIVTYIRSSSYNNYAYCQMQYFITYVLGYQSKSGKKQTWEQWYTRSWKF